MCDGIETEPVVFSGVRYVRCGQLSPSHGWHSIHLFHELGRQAPDDPKYAVKWSPDPDEVLFRQLTKARSLVRGCGHLITIIDLAYRDLDMSVLVLMPVVGTRDLGRLLRRDPAAAPGEAPVALTPASARRVMWAVACALRFLHGRGLCHLNVAPSNVLVHTPANPADYEAVLTGLSLLTARGAEFAPTDCAPRPPELGARRTATADPAVDVFQAGELFHRMFDPGDAGADDPEPVRDLIAGMTAADPRRRWAIDAVCRHAHFRGLE
jgi:serine/threonine protein kinase